MNTIINKQKDTQKNINELNQEKIRHIVLKKRVEAIINKYDNDFVRGIEENFDNLFKELSASNRFYKNNWIFKFDLDGAGASGIVLDFLLNELEDEDAYEDWFQMNGSAYEMFTHKLISAVLYHIEKETTPPLNPHYNQDPDAIDWTKYNKYEYQHKTHLDYHSKLLFPANYTPYGYINFLKSKRNKNKVYRFSLHPEFLAKLKFYLGQEDFLKLKKIIKVQAIDIYRYAIEDFLDSIPVSYDQAHEMVLEDNKYALDYSELPY